MQTIPLAPLPAPADLPRPWRWTRADVRRLDDLGVFAGSRVELVGGEILEMSPKKPTHAVATKRVERVLEAIFPAPNYTVRVQDPLALGEWDEPEPGLAVVPGHPEEYLADHPTGEQTLLVVEISDSTVGFDRGRKADRYAAAGVRDYWIIDLPAGIVEVCREATPREGIETEISYSTRQRHGRGAVFTPLAAPDRAVAVDDLLPPNQA
jgi:Uma2 family endonuclease